MAGNMAGASSKWLEDIALFRLSQRTNVYIIVTEDKTRINQLIDALVSDQLPKELFKISRGYNKILEYNILRKELSTLSAQKMGEKIIGVQRNPEPIPMGSRAAGGYHTVTTVIDDALHHTARVDERGAVTGPQGAAVLIHWVLTKGHAENLQDWLAAWSQDDLLYRNRSTVFVFTTDEALFIEPVRRLSSVLQIHPGSDEEIRGRLQDLANQAQATNKELKLQVTDQIVQSARGLNLHQAETAALEGVFTSKSKPKCFQTYTFKNLKVQLLESAGLTFVHPNIGFDSIGSYDYLKREMQDFVIDPLHNPSLTKQYGLGLPRGIILHGEPGTGKTLFSKACAQALGLAMLTITPADLYRGIVGESESRIKKITGLIESLAPIVVFIDEIDQLFLKRDQVSSTDSGVNRRILNGLLQWLGDDERQSFVIGATNRIQDMDDAAYRPGRFDECIYVTYPDQKGREEIFNVQCTKLNQYPIKDIDYAELAGQVPFITGAEIAKWCTLAARQAMREKVPNVTMDHFKKTILQISFNQMQRAQDMQRQCDQLRTISNFNIPLMEEATRTLRDEISMVNTTGDSRMATFARTIEGL
jgi:AAA+ superfamily predicted ATPase